MKSANKKTRNELFDLTFLSSGRSAGAALSLTNRIPFPMKLFRMLEDAEENGDESIVSWSKDGTSFKVHDINAFVEKIMPSYFRQTRYKVRNSTH